jgi:protein-S-isoprenylcysteine O-methyltransferase Ste14
VTSLSVFAALLFNLLLLTYDIIAKASTTEKKIFLKEVYSNISYSILVAVITVVITLLFDIMAPMIREIDSVAITYAIYRILNGFIYFIAGNFILSLLMVLKRIHVLMSTEFNSGQNL